MTRKKNRRRAASKSLNPDTQALDGANNALNNDGFADGKSGTTSTAVGNSKPVERDSESNPYKYVMVLILMQYLGRLDEAIETERDKLLAYFSPQRTSRRLLIELGNFQAAVSEKIKELEKKKQKAKDTFVANLYRLAEGVDYHRLPLIDESMTITELESMAAGYVNCESPSNSSYTSEDSALGDDDGGKNTSQYNCKEDFTFTSSSAGCTRLPPADWTHKQPAEAKAMLDDSAIIAVHDQSDMVHDDVSMAAGMSMGQDPFHSDEFSSFHAAPSRSNILDEDKAPLTNAEDILELLKPIDQIPSRARCTHNPLLQGFNDDTLSEASSTENISKKIEEARNEEENVWLTVKKKKKSDVNKLGIAKTPIKPTVPLPSQNFKPASTPMANGKFRGDEQVKRRKTEMCQSYKLGKCGWGAQCNYAHSEEEMQEALRKLNGAKESQPMKSDVKTLPAEVISTPYNNVRFKGPHGEKRRKTEMCKNFQLGVCGWGPDCNYAHSVDELRTSAANESKPKPNENGGASKLTIDPSPSANIKFKGAEGAKLRKTELCENFKLGRCTWGKDCNYAHSVDELKANHLSSAQAGRYGAAAAPAVKRGTKLLMCKSFQIGTCKRNAEDCKYAHDESELDENFDHDEPCDNQQCAARLRYERRKTVMCPDVSTPRGCKFGNECTYAHKENELRALPKHEMCNRYARGRCINASNCVYAHSRDELRPNRERDLIPFQKAASVKVKSTSWSQIASGHNNRSADDEEEECIICSLTVSASEKVALPCAHNFWHFECISKWLNDYRPHCPFCNHPARLPDLYVAPAGMSGKDFPLL